MTIFTLLPPNYQLLSPFFMQDPNKSRSRWKIWYERAIEVSRLWKALQKPAEIPIKNVTLWKTNDTRRKRGKSSSTRVGVASSFTHVCLCAPISSYANVFQNDVVSPRRSRSYRRSTSLSTGRQQEMAAPPVSRQLGRKIFRGKSLTDDLLMRRFVIEEATMQVRRRNEMEIIRRRSGIRNNKIGPSLLSRMTMADDD
ncbi:hypothetical protein ACS0TY_023829 [Phlomoides rotata]